MWAVFKDPVSAYLERSPGDIALVSSVMLSAFVFGILFGGILQDRFGPQAIAVLGSVVMSSGILLTSFVTSDSASLIYLTYGVIGGFGVGTVYLCTVSCVQKWFPDKRGFATGAMVGAFGFSLVIFTPLATYLLEETGVPMTFRILGSAFMIICVISALILINPPEGFTAPGKITDTGKKQFTPSEMVRTKEFYLISGSLFLVLPAFFILNPHLVTLATERGFAEYATMGVMITGVFSAAGRLLITWMSDKTGRIPAMVFIAVITAIGVFALTAASGYLFLICVALISFTFGGASGVYAAVTADHFGTKNMGTNYGIVIMGFGASALLFPYLTNIISSPGDMTNAFILAAVTCILALVLVLMLRTSYKGRDY
jgi:OFA family oxalate/formate antiporter-like MFS transporter